MVLAVLVVLQVQKVQLDQVDLVDLSLQQDQVFQEDPLRIQVVPVILWTLLYLADQADQGLLRVQKDLEALMILDSLNLPVVP